MMYTAYITDTTTGEERTYDFKNEWDEVQNFLWADGNYGCDCNRQLFFEYAAGQDTDTEECGEGRFPVRIKYQGEWVYNDHP